MPENLFDIKDKVVVVTGGLGQLGRHFSLTLLEQGARVGILDINADSQLIMDRFGEYKDNPNLFFIRADITNRSSLEEALSVIKDRWGTPHALINNAALDSPPNAPAGENGPFETYPESSWDRVMDVNAKGTFLCCQVFGSAMAVESRGSVINISSIYGVVSPDQRIYEYRRERGNAFYKPVAYSVSKSAIINLTRYLATYWAPKNVRVNTLTFAGVFNNQDENFLKGYLAKVPLGRMATPKDYAGAVIFLISDASAYMTGSNMVIDGGWTAW